MAFQHNLTRGLLAASLLLAPPSLTSAQTTDAASALAARSTMIVRGTVTQVHATAEASQKPTAASIVITVTKMYAGSEFFGDQTGHQMTVVLANPGAVQVGSDALFFGKPRAGGKTVTLADEGEIALSRGVAEPPTLAAAVQTLRDAPLRARLAVATLVIRGTVTSVRPLQAAAAAIAGRPAPRDEHDPDWQVALVRVTTTTKGTAPVGQSIPVIFPASRDIIWFNVPKLHVGQDSIFLLHRPQTDELSAHRELAAFDRVDTQPTYLISHPLDVLPVSEGDHLHTLL